MTADPSPRPSCGPGTPAAPIAMPAQRPEPDTLDLDLDLNQGRGSDPDDGIPWRGPLTRAQAAALGCSRSPFDRLWRSGRLVRQLHGVYADVTLPVDTPFRAEAVRLAVRPGQVATGRTAAWLHGADVAAFTPRSHPAPPPVPTQRAAPRTYASRDLVEIGGVTVTTPMRTLLDLARRDEPRVALAVADTFVRDGLLEPLDLLADLVRAPAVDRALLALADPRAAGAEESTLRWHWMRSTLPTPVPGLVVAESRDRHRTALGLPVQRFAAVLRRPGPRGPQDAGMRALREQGWWIVALDTGRVLAGSGGQLRRHLEREYHQALLREVG